MKKSQVTMIGKDDIQSLREGELVMFRSRNAYHGDLYGIAMTLCPAENILQFAKLDRDNSSFLHGTFAYSFNVFTSERKDLRVCQGNIYSDYRPELINLEHYKLSDPKFLKIADKYLKVLGYKPNERLSREEIESVHPGLLESVERSKKNMKGGNK